MVAKPLKGVGGQNADVARRGVFAGALQQQRASIINHDHPVPIQLRTRHTAAAAYANVVGAVHARTARTPVYEEIIITAPAPNIGGLNRTVVGQLVGGGTRSNTQPG